MAPQHLLLALVIDLFWGLNFVAARIGVTEIPALLLLTLRFGLTLALLLPFLRWKRGQMREILLVGVLAGILQFALFFVGTALSNASVAAILAQLQLPFATVLSIVLLHEHVGWRRWTGIGFALLGIAVLGFDPIILHYWVGALLVTAAGLCTAFSQIIMRRMKSIGVFELQAWIAAVTMPGVFLLSIIFERHDWHKLGEAPIHIWGIVAYTTLLANIFGQGGMFFLLKRYDVALVVTLTVLAQVFGIIFGVVLLHEPMTWRVAIGAAIICFGVLIIASRQGRARMPSTPGEPAAAVALVLAEPEVGIVPSPLKSEAEGSKD
jgi:O-acetylserine/cysteine efflux transporter